jgi:hypothetical protein
VRFDEFFGVLTSRAVNNMLEVAILFENACVIPVERSRMPSTASLPLDTLNQIHSPTEDTNRNKQQGGATVGNDPERERVDNVDKRSMEWETRRTMIEPEPRTLTIPIDCFSLPLHESGLGDGPSPPRLVQPSTTHRVISALPTIASWAA